MAIPGERLNNALLKMAQWLISLELPEEIGGVIFGNFIKENGEHPPNAMTSEGTTACPIAERLIQMPDSLTERESKILEPHFSRHDGLLNYARRVEGQTIQKHRERIRLVKAKALLWNFCHPKPPIKRIPQIFESRAIKFPL